MLMFYSAFPSTYNQSMVPLITIQHRYFVILPWYLDYKMTFLDDRSFNICSQYIIQFFECQRIVIFSHALHIPFRLRIRHQLNVPYNISLILEVTDLSALILFWVVQRLVRNGSTVEPYPSCELNNNFSFIDSGKTILRCTIKDRLTYPLFFGLAQEWKTVYDRQRIE